MTLCSKDKPARVATADDQRWEVNVTCYSYLEFFKIAALVRAEECV